MLQCHSFFIVFPAGCFIGKSRLAYFCTLFTLPKTSLIGVGIRQVIRMLFWAMSCTSVTGSNPVSTKNIYSTSNNVKMFWINTRANTAKMINCKPFWDWGYKIFVSKPMGKNKGFAILKIAVPLRLMSTASPKPTGSVVPERSVFINFGPEASRNDITQEHRKVSPFGVVRRAVYAVPSLTIVPREVYRCRQLLGLERGTSKR